MQGDDASKRARDELPADVLSLQPAQKTPRVHAPPASASPSSSNAGLAGAPVQPQQHVSQQSNQRTPHDPVAGRAPVPNHLSINYLARRYADDLPLINLDDSLTHSIYLLNSYYEAMDRSESLASNLGAKPLGTIIVKRFERLFDGSPRIIHATRAGRRSTTVTWLDVAQFAGGNSPQYDIMHLEDGRRVCQFVVKNCTVQVNEEDWLMIKSGLPQNIIPPQPIAEDEEKELGTLEILEAAVKDVSHLADQVAARARQFNHRLKGRKQAIIERRMAQTAISGAAAMRASSPSNMAFANGESPQPSTSRAADGQPDTTADQDDFANPATVSQPIRDELLKSFAATRHGTSTPSKRPSTQHAATMRPTQTPASAPESSADAAFTPSRPATNPTPTPRNIQPEDGGPFKSTMVLRLELLGKHERIMPPCDRCRRLKIDCLKNLSACVGCTKKHAKCAWRDVSEDEMIESDPHYHRGSYPGLSTLYAASMPAPAQAGDVHEHSGVDGAADFAPEHQHDSAHHHDGAPSSDDGPRATQDQDFFDAPSGPAAPAAQMLDPSLEDAGEAGSAAALGKPAGGDINDGGAGTSPDTNAKLRRAVGEDTRSAFDGGS